MIPSRGCPVHWIPAVVALLLAGTPAPSRAQDAHYWSMQYGPGASLLGGAVIGSVDGLAAVYYNPGRLTGIERGSFSLSAMVFDWETLTVEDGVSPGRDLSSTRSGLEPALFAGILPFGGEDQVWAYSFLTRQQADTDIAASEDIQDPVAAFGTLRLENRIADHWGGLSWALEPAPGIGVGVSGFVALRSTNRRAEVVSASVDPGVGSAALIDLSGYEFWHVRALAKLGGWYRLGAVDLGLSLTTPSVGLYGRGDAAGGRALIGVGAADDLVASVQEGLDATYRSPFSAGAGLGWTLGATRLHLSAEWFAGVDRYVAMEADPVPGAAESFRISAVHEADPVFNWGAGLEHRFSDRVTGFASYAMDRSSAAGGDSNIGTANWDISNVAVGTGLDLPWVQLTVGAGLAFGETPLTDVLQISGTDDGGLVDPGNNTLRYRNWRMIFAFGF